MDNSLENFVENIRSFFSEAERASINKFTDIKLLNEWSSLQAMITVNEIHNCYGVLIESKDFKEADTLIKLHKIVSYKIKMV